MDKEEVHQEAHRQNTKRRGAETYKEFVRRIKNNKRLRDKRRAAREEK